MKKIIGIDIGGTKISLIVATVEGRILAKGGLLTRTGKTEARLCVNEMLRKLREMTAVARVRKRELLGIGVCIPGPVNTQTGVVPWSPNLRGWQGIPLRQIIKRHFSVPVFMDNDANAAGFGEKIFGAGKRIKDFVYITVSTGIGGGLVLGGKIHRGASFCGGEIGHITVVPDGNLCKCGKRGCLEAYASGTAIGKAARMELAKVKKSKLLELAPSIKRVTGENVTQAAFLGDRLSLEILRCAARYLGIGLATIMNLLNPGMIVLGGGVIKAGKHIWKPMMASVKKEAWPAAFKACRVIKTELGEHVGNLGAAALVLSKDIC